MKEKIAEILKIYEKKHIDFYLEHSKEEMDNYIEELLKKYNCDTIDDVFYIVKLVLKYMLNALDSHTKIDYMDYNLCGMNFKFLNDGLYVIRTTDEYSKFRFLKVVAVDGILINDIVSQIADITIYASPKYLECETELYLNYLLLKYLPSFKGKEIVTFDFENGESVRYNLNKVCEKYFKNGDNYHYDIYNDTVIFTYLSCMEPDEGFMNETVKKIKLAISDKKIKNFVIDLRGNTGGNSEIIHPLISFISENNYNVIVLIDKYIFSSATIVMKYLKEIGGIFVGTDICTPINHYGEVYSEKHKIGDIDYLVNISQKYFYIDNEELISVSTSKELETLDKSKFIPIYYHPDIYVDDKIEWYINGRDLYLEKVLKIINNHISNSI